jgi:predicted RNA-binding Zn ribbon-like protein
LVIDFANTLVAVRGRVVDLLREPGGADRWLATREARLGQRVVPGGIPLLIAVRGAIRGVLEARFRGDTPRVEDLTLLNRTAAGGEARPRLVWETTPPRLSFESDDLPSLLAAEAMALVAGRDGDRIRRCRNPRCVLLFMAPDGRRVYCSAACAARARAARHDARHPRS